MLNPALELLREIRSSGAMIGAVDGTLRVTAPPGLLTDAVKNRIATLKPQLLALVDDAVDLLCHRGVRLIGDRGRIAIGIWRDAKDEGLHQALEVAGFGDCEVVYLDDPAADIPERYRRFVPEYVKNIWAAQGLLATPSERLEAEAKASFLNRLFDALGTSPQPSRITGAAVLHGMLAKRKPLS